MKNILLSLTVALLSFNLFALTDNTPSFQCNAFFVEVNCANGGTEADRIRVNITAPGMTYTIGGSVYTGSQTNITVNGPFPIDFITTDPTFAITSVSGTGTITVTQAISEELPGPFLFV